MVSTTSTPTPTTQTTTSSSFYLLRDDPPREYQSHSCLILSQDTGPCLMYICLFWCIASTSSDTSTGSGNLLVQHGLEQVYHKFCSKKVKESLSAFLPHVPGKIPCHILICLVDNSDTMFCFVILSIDYVGDSVYFRIRCHKRH